jgi:ATP-dependent RNA helicase RhlE
MGQKAVRLDRVSILVLDEADHMFDMGFLPDVRRILEALPERRQNLLFSATMPREIRGLANRLLHQPHVVELDHSRPVETVEHALLPVDSGRKLELLERLLAEKDLVSAIVFTRTKHRAKRIARQLGEAGHRAVALQGNMSQGQRERAMDGFRARQFRILVATDIAARGLDIEQVSHVVNFDMPTTPDGYTHRIGRTGRSERRGRAYTFVTPEDAAMVREVELRIGAPIPHHAFEGFRPEPSKSEAARPARASSDRRAEPRSPRRRSRSRQRRRGPARVG